MERLEELTEESRELNSLLQKHREDLQLKETHERELQAKIAQLERETQQYQNKLEEKEGEMVRVVHDKNEEYEEMSRINEELRQLLQKKQEEAERSSSEWENHLNELKDEVQFYRNKLEEEGINLKMDEASFIKDIIEKKEEEEKEKLAHLEDKYRHVLAQLHQDKLRLEREIAELKELNGRLARDGTMDDKKQIEKEIESLFCEYDSELIRKDEEILELKKLSEEYKKMAARSECGSGEELRAIDSIKNIILKEKLSGDSVDQTHLQFFYIVDKLVRYVRMYGYNLFKEKEERLKLTKKLTALNLYVNRELEKAEEKAASLEVENRKGKHTIAEQSREIRKLTARLGAYRSKLAENAGKPCTVQQLEIEFMELEIRRLIEKYGKARKYAQELEVKLVDEFSRAGSVCEHLCLFKQANEKREADTASLQEVEYNRMLSQIKEEYSRSILSPTPTDPMELAQQSKLARPHIAIASSVISHTSKPTKAPIAPLPPLALSQPAPTSLTLDKLLTRKSLIASLPAKRTLALKLMDLGLELFKFSKKLFSLKPYQMLVNNI